jgi:hypothetical protein
MLECGVFESRDRLAAEIGRLLDGLLGAAGARYACIMEPERILFEAPVAEGKLLALRRFLEDRGRAVFSIPAGLAEAAPLEDVFEGWDHDDFFLAFVNGRVALVVACPEAARVEGALQRGLAALADRLLRWNETYRLDAQGRGLFFGQPRLDTVIVGRQAGSR